jgi:hypothetical protein
MTMFNTTCTRCGRDLSAPTSACFVQAPATAQGLTVWVFCPTCDDLVSLALPPTMLATLTDAGCHVVDLAAGASHPEQRPGGAPLGADDVLALHELLSDDDALAAAVDEFGIREI